VRRKCLPEVFEEDAFATLDEFEGNGAVHEVKMPESRSRVDLFPDLTDAWNGASSNASFLRRWILCSVGVGHHPISYLQD
jgi:hypothetical protein